MPQGFLAVKGALTGAVWACLTSLMLLNKTSRAAWAWIGFAVLLDAVLPVAWVFALLASCIAVVSSGASLKRG